MNKVRKKKVCTFEDVVDPLDLLGNGLFRRSKDVGLAWRGTKMETDTKASGLLRL